MELLHPHCAGLDLHKETVVACIRHLRRGKVTTEIRTFKTTTEELIALSDWGMQIRSLRGARARHVSNSRSYFTFLLFKVYVPRDAQLRACRDFRSSGSAARRPH